MSIFDETDNQEKKSKGFGSKKADNNFDEQLICNNMEKLLDDEMEFKKSLKNADEDDNNSLFNQFESADHKAEKEKVGYTGGNFESFGFSMQTNNSEIKFPEENNIGESFGHKPF